MVVCVFFCDFRLEFPPFSLFFPLSSHCHCLVVRLFGLGSEHRGWRVDFGGLRNWFVAPLVFSRLLDGESKNFSSPLFPSLHGLSLLLFLPLALLVPPSFVFPRRSLHQGGPDFGERCRTEDALEGTKMTVPRLESFLFLSCCFLLSRSVFSFFLPFTWPPRRRKGLRQ